jgi:hypothetical protein
LSVGTASAADTITFSPSFAKIFPWRQRAAGRLVPKGCQKSTTARASRSISVSASSSSWRQRSGRSVALSITLQLKVDFKARAFCKDSVNVRMVIGRGDLEPYARTNDFRGGATSWAPSIGDSVLRENWTATPSPANQRAETIQHHSALPASNHSARASTRFYIE